MSSFRTCVILALSLGLLGCAQEHSGQAGKGAVAAAELQPAQQDLAKAPTSQTGAAEPGEYRGAAGEMATSSRGDATVQPIATDEELLAAYREVYCHQKRGDPAAVTAVWERYGFTSASWADAARKAVRRAHEDPDGFGRSWSRISHKPCP